jgi:hypothetical protein
LVNVNITPGFSSMGGVLDIVPTRDARVFGRSMAFDLNGNPVVTWTEFDGTSNNVYVKRWTGTAWEQVGNSFLDVNTNRDAYAPSIALGSSGNPVVAWSETDGTSNNIYVKRFNQ